MTTLLEQAFAEAASLPPDEQDALAAWIIEELRAGRRWQRNLEQSEVALGQLADEAIADYSTARTRPVGYAKRRISEEEYAKNFAIGRREGLLASIAAVIDIKFGMLGRILLPEIERVADPDRLGAILDFLTTATSPAAVRAAFPDVDYPKPQRR